MNMYMAVITLTDRISAALDRGEIVGGVFLDFSEAIDAVSHEILLKKVCGYDIQNVPSNSFKKIITKIAICHI